MPFGGENMDERLKERHCLPYDAMVPGPSWLGETDTETEVAENEETEEIQTDKIQGEGLGL